MPDIFLCCHNKAGETQLQRLDNSDNTSWILPPAVSDSIDLTQVPDAEAYVQIELVDGLFAVSTYNYELCLLRVKSEQKQLPNSTDAVRRSFVLREGEEFITNAGRWQILAEDEAMSHSVSHSMRPPPPIPMEPIQSSPGEPHDTTELLKGTRLTMQEIEDTASPSESDPDEDRTTDIMNMAAQPSSPNRKLKSPDEITNGPPVVDDLSEDKENNAPGPESELEGTPDVGVSVRKRKAEKAGQRARDKKRRVGLRASGVGADEVAETPAINSSSPPRTQANNTPTSSAATRTSKRRQRKSSTASDGYDGALPKVYFASNTTIDQKKGTMKTFFGLGGAQVNSIDKANFFCVKDNELVKSSSLLQAILRGIHIVNEEWIVAAHRSRKFADPAQHIPSDPNHELEWSFEISNAVQRGREGFPRLLAGITVWLTGRLKESLTSKVARDLSNVASGLGAVEVKCGIPKKTVQTESVTDLVIGVNEDPQVAEVGRLGHKLYEKEILTMAVLRGVLELESTDFLVKSRVKEEDDD